MASNREKKVYLEAVHILMGLKRPSKGQSKSDCIRQVVKDFDLDLKLLEAKLKVFGGEWRIHCTVNQRCVKTATKFLVHNLIDYEEKGSYADSEWRTCLLKRECIFGEQKFMLDVDTQEPEKIEHLKEVINTSTKGYKWNFIEEIIKTPKGYHFITKKFDTREVCKLDYVTLLRDGYYYVKTVKFPEVENG